ncbi:MAG: hypothetical protein ABF289_05245 [Clostridiales bacterium]
MKYRINLISKSPIMIGEKKTKSNYFKSLNNFPGSVFYAALAKEISYRCFYNETKEFDENNNEKMFWVKEGKVDNKDCMKNDCSVKNLCRMFKKIKVSHFYPFGLGVLPLTAKVSKDYGDKICDILHENILMDLDYEEYKKIRKKYENEFGRVENKKGLNIYSRNDFDYKTYKCFIEEDYHLITRSAIDPLRKSAEYGSLFSYDLLKSIKLNRKIEEYGKDTIEEDNFTGYIKIDSDNEKIKENIINEIINLDNIYLGGMISIGYGKCNIDNINREPLNLNKTDSIVDRINNFNKYLKKYNMKDKIYIPILLESDAYIFDNFGTKINDLNSKSGLNPSNIETEDYKELIKNEFIKDKELSSEFTLEKIFAEYESLRGFDTSKQIGFLRDISIVMKSGSVILMSIKKIDAKIMGYLEKISSDGIGEKNEYGFGAVKICDDFHNKYKRNLS